ncbi:MAG: phosphotransferase [Gemmataceae bacterium]
METLSLDQIARSVVLQFPVLGSADRLQFLGNHGGFSGAKLWRLSARDGDFCLRAWPAGKTTPKKLDIIHAFMKRARDAGLAIVPSFYPTAQGASFVEESGRHWEVTSWMPGRPDFKEVPSRLKLRQAASALARLHRSWLDFPFDTGPCPAVHRRLSCLRAWVEKTRSGWRPTAWDPGSAGILPLAEQAKRLLERWTPRLAPLLEPWTERPLPLQMCVCDIWHDHLLFEGEILTGLIDFGSIKRDHVAVDLSRMLGSLVGDSSDQWQEALTSYTRIRPLTDAEAALINVLDRSGAVLAIANWLTWLYWDRRPFDNYSAVQERLAAFIGRVEMWG